MRASIKILGQAKRAGIRLIAVCHNMHCRCRKLINIDSVVQYVGVTHEVVPVFGVRHFSERMTCPKCDQRGMFIWTLSEDEPEPVSGGSQYQVNAWEGGSLVATLCKASEFEIAVAAFKVAITAHPQKRNTLQERSRILRDSNVQKLG